MEEVYNGKRITRNEKGQFVKVELDREKAQEMQVKSTLAQKNAGSEQLLQEAGYEPGTAPEHLKVLAQIAASKRSGSVGALRDFRSITQGVQQEQSKARGKHKIEAMSDIVVELKRRNWSPKKIALKLGMDQDEVLRLCQISGLAEMFRDEEFTEAWEAEILTEEDQIL